MNIDEFSQYHIFACRTTILGTPTGSLTKYGMYTPPIPCTGLPSPNLVSDASTALAINCCIVIRRTRECLIEPLLIEHREILVCLKLVFIVPEIFLPKKKDLYRTLENMSSYSQYFFIDSTAEQGITNHPCILHSKKLFVTLT